MADCTDVLYEFACRCAEDALKLIDDPDERSIAAIEAKRKWLKGKIGDKELAYAAAYAAYAADAAAYAAAYAADSAAYAAYAADAAAYAAYAADAARKKTLEKAADIVRKHYPKPPKF